jgi:tetratricopeptide (TPR) repeat protein
MENFLFFFALFLALLTIYRMLRRRHRGPEATVRELLRRYHSFEKAGVPEEERLFRLFFTRRSWQSLPQPFLTELVVRLRSKDDVLRFIALAEGYGYEQSHFPSIAHKHDSATAMLETAYLLGDLGHRLQKEGRLKNAEYVQKLALRIEPDQYFTNLPLAITYYRMDRYGDAAPLFKQGLSSFAKFEKENNSAAQLALAAGRLAADGDVKSLIVSCKNMYDACLKAQRAG